MTEKGVFRLFTSSSFLRTALFRHGIRSAAPFGDMAPVNSPMNPEKTNPPMAARKMTSIGTEEPFPMSSGFSALSERAMISRGIVHRIAGSSSFAVAKKGTG